MHLILSMQWVRSSFFLSHTITRRMVNKRMAWRRKIDFDLARLSAIIALFSRINKGLWVSWRLSSGHGRAISLFGVIIYRSVMQSSEVARFPRLFSCGGGEFRALLLCCIAPLASQRLTMKSN
jgi:hypothetical protein